MQMANLDELRAQIDEVDKKLVNILEERLDIVSNIGKYKIENNLPVIDRKRANLVVQKAVDRLNNPNYSGEITEIVSSIIHVSENMEERRNTINPNGRYIESVINASKPSKINDENIKIVYQGTEGSFGQAALYEYFGRDKKNIENLEEFEDVFESVCGGDADYGVLPIENSQTGSIVEIYDLFRKYRAYIVGETELGIQQNLLGIKGTETDEIKTVYSHQQGLLQCKEFLKEHPKMETVALSNTAVSAKYVAEHQDKTKAAIASKIAAEAFGLEVLAENINTQSNNTTKFIIISKSPEISRNASKISLCFTLPNTPGALSQVMLVFAKNKLNMLKIESRPIQNKKFEYFFFCDIAGNINDDSVKTALKEAAMCIGYLEILGNY